MSDATQPAIIWFRNDLRLSDNPALRAAAASERPLIAIYVLDDDNAGDWKMGGASRWWLHHSLETLAASVKERGGKLVLQRGKANDIIPALATETGAAAVYWNRAYEPWAIARDKKIKATLTGAGIEARSVNGALIVEPWEISTKQGKPYKVFTPFWKSIKAGHTPADPVGVPENLRFSNVTAGDALKDWALLPTKPDWAGGLRATWTPGEAAAHGRLGAFIQNGLADYDTARDKPAVTGTSGLSAHLHFGEISPRQVWHAIKQSEHGDSEDADSYLSEIAWREFSYNLLYHFPEFPEDNFQPRFDHFEWTGTDAEFEAWTKGQTGYPIVDAGMRQLYQTGWMHNRVRMIVASFLVKDLFIHWRRGEDWFWDTLVDADLASNAAGWQWVAGSGADAAPYFRIFNPVSQGEKFDPDGDYVRKYVPELANLPKRAIHAPWTADRATLALAGVTLGKDYPQPIVDHAEARKKALAAFEKIKDAA
ncbi:DNA photolyase family protein [Maricaulaceae bacterium NA33B04]|nr:DNA photolyase family protein [Maricaulaceae bacterium NA33B04]